jgi:hypothetical protein
MPRQLIRQSAANRLFGDALAVFVGALNVLFLALAVSGAL